jgi:hypothetical protein
MKLKKIISKPFKWQRSFHNHIIEDEFGLHNHIEYLKNQSEKHGLNENKWLFIDKNVQ